MPDIASRDANRIPTLLGVDSSQFSIPTKVAVDAITHAMLVENTASTAVIGHVIVDSGTLTAITNALPTGTNTIGNIQVTDGTNSANILKSDGTAAGQNALLVGGSSYAPTVTPQSTGGQLLVASTVALGFKSFSWQGDNGGTSPSITIQGCNDNTNWKNLIIADPTSWSNISNSTNGQEVRTGPITTKYIRVLLNSISGGTQGGVFILSSIPFNFPASGITQNGIWTVGSNSATGSAVPANAFYIATRAASGNLTGINDANNGEISSGLIASGGYYYSPVSAAIFQRIRTPDIFNSAQATASGDTAVWTPTTGKKFRIMRFKVQVTANAVITSGGVLTIKLRDATTDLNLTHDVFVPGAAVTTTVGDYDSGWIDLGNGKLSAGANNVLNINLSAAVTTGNVRVVVAGTEE